MRRNKFLDVTPDRREGDLPVRPDSTLTGVIVEDLGGGKVAVAVDGAPEDWPPVVAVSEAGLTAVGARVRLPRDSSGRVVAASSPLSLPEGAEPVPVGVTGRAVVEALEAARAAGVGLAQAQAKADAAATDAVAAMVAAGKVVTVSSTAPESPADGQLWAVTEAGSARIVGLRLWAGGEWVPHALLADSVIVPGSVGTIALADGAVTAPKVLASNELWANLLTVAGDATIGGSLLAEIITGKTLIGSQVIATQGERDVSLPAAEQSLVQAFGWVARPGGGWQRATTGAGRRINGVLLSIVAAAPDVDTTRAAWSVRVRGSGLEGLEVLVRPQGGQLVPLVDGEWVTLTGTGKTAIIDFQVPSRDDLPAGAVVEVEPATVTVPASQVALTNLDDGTPAVVYEDVDAGLHTVMSPDGLEITQTGVVTTIPWRNVGLAIAPPRGYLADTGSQTLPNATWTRGGLQVRQLEAGVTADQSGVRVPVAGYYRINARGKFAANQTGRRIVGIMINGVNPETNMSIMAPQGTASVECNASVFLEAGDLVQIGLFQQSGGNLLSPGRELTVTFESEKAA